MNKPQVSYRPDLPDWGVYLSWPDMPPGENETWIHADDLAVAKQLIPSRRVLRRDRWDGEYYHVHYGNTRIRVRPSMWVAVGRVDLNVGQQVELLSRNFANDPGVFRIADIFYIPERNQIQFFLHGNLLRRDQAYSREDLRPLKVHYKLRTGSFKHQPPRSKIPEDVPLLDVGNLTGNESATGQ